MKKYISLALALILAMSMVACNGIQQEENSIYSFYGANEYFTVSDGNIFLNTSEEAFEGGILQVTQTGILTDVVSFSTVFYTIKNGEQRVILSNKVEDMTGGTVSVDGDLGRISGDGVVLGNEAKNIDELKENLWFQLKTTDLNGKENVYRIKLTVTEVTSSPNV